MLKQKQPRIRFEGFSGDWDERKIGELTNVSSAARVHKEEWASSGVPFFRSSDVVSAYKGKDNAKAFISYQLFEQLSQISGRLEKDDIILTGGGSIGIPYKVPNNEPLYSKDADLIWVKNASEFDSQYIYTFFSTIYFRKYIGSISHIGTIAHYTIEQVKNTPVCLPEIKEQTQIGTFFQQLDQAIALHQRKHTQTLNLKKAMLEKMFPKAGCTQPEIRFKGFSGDWGVDNQKEFLSNFISIKHGFAFSGEFITDTQTDFYLLTPVNFAIGGGFKSNKFVYYTGAVPTDYILKENDLIVTMTDLSKESDTLGLPALIPQMDGKTLLHNQRLGLIKFMNNELDKKFLFYLMQNSSYQNFIVRSATGTTVKHTSPSKIQSFSFFKPNVEEQTQIGNFFKQLDDTIALQTQQLAKLKNIKQACLEKMFV